MVLGHTDILHTTIHSRIHTSESATQYEHYLGTQDVRGAQGTVAPGTFLNGCRNPWVDIQPNGLQVKESSANKLTVELPKPRSKELARLAAGAHLHYRAAAV